MKRRRKKRRFIKFIIFIVLIIIIMNFFKLKINFGKAVNLDYDGIGQKEINNKDGYSTIFITEENHKKEYIEYKQGKGSSWSQNSYWDGTMEENGCGITSLSIIISGYEINKTPEDLRKKYTPHLDGEKMADELRNTFDIECSDFYFASALFNKAKLIEHLKTNRPVLICVWNKPNNRWTEKSHYMVLLATDGDDEVYISNPNGYEKSTVSGWYKFEDIIPYIAKALFVEKY